MGSRNMSKVLKASSTHDLTVVLGEPHLLRCTHLPPALGVLVELYTLHAPRGRLTMVFHDDLTHLGEEAVKRASVLPQ